jgi:hypothetical protein
VEQRRGSADGIERRHSGIGMSVDQKIGCVTLFRRYGHQVPARCASTARSRRREIAGAWDARRLLGVPSASCAPAPPTAAIRSLDLDADGNLDRALPATSGRPSSTTASS